MNQARLKDSAERLLEALNKYAPQNKNAALLRDSLLTYIQDALEEKIEPALAWRDVPGAYFFTETDLPKFRDLEAAYAQFKIEITGGETPQRSKLLEKIRAMG